MHTVAAPKSQRKPNVNPLVCINAAFTSRKLVFYQLSAQHLRPEAKLSPVSIPQRASLPTLPTEIVGQITALLNDNDLVNLAASSPLLNSIAEAQLYDHVIIDSKRQRLAMPSELPENDDDEFSPCECPDCGTGCTRSDLTAHRIHCQDEIFVRKVSFKLSEAVAKRGRSILVKKLDCDITADTIQSVKSILNNISAGIEDICISTDPGSEYLADLMGLDLQPWRYTEVLSVLGRRSQLRYLRFHIWPRTLDLMRDLLPRLASMERLQVLRVSFPERKWNSRVDTWKRTDQISVLGLTEIHLHGISWRFRRTVAHLIASSPRLEHLSISWKFLERDENDTLCSEGESIEDYTGERDEASAMETMADPSAVQVMAKRLGELKRLKSVTWTESIPEYWRPIFDISFPVLASSTLTTLSVRLTDDFTRQGRIEVSQQIRGISQKRSDITYTVSTRATLACIIVPAVHRSRTLPKKSFHWLRRHTRARHFLPTFGFARHICWTLQSLETG